MAFSNPFAAPPAADVLAGLNPEQHAAACHEDGPALVLSGAGTGKTTLIVARIGRLVVVRKADPRRILAVTFTRAAAQEMRERLTKRIGVRGQAVAASTFHAAALKQLAEHPELAGLRPGFELADDAAAAKLLRDVIVTTLDDDEQPPDRDAIKAMLQMIGRLKDGGHTPEAVAAMAPVIRASFEREEDQVLFDTTAPWMGAYHTALRAQNLADFGDMLLWPTLAMERSEQLRSAWAGRFDWIMVDEYQDTNPLQERWLTCMAGEHRNLVCVGDDDQSMYGFRGAESDYIRNFGSRWQGAAIFVLQRNYRSTPNILAAGNAVIAHNPGRHEKELLPGLASAGRGQPITIGRAETRTDEATWVAEMCRVVLERHDSVFIIYRAGWLSRVFEEGILRAGLTYQIVGDVGFYGRQEIKDALAYLQVIEDPTCTDAWRRIVNLPARGLGEKAQDLIMAAASAQAVQDGVPAGDLLEAGRRVGRAGGFRLKAAAEGAELLAVLRDRWIQRCADALSFDERLGLLLAESGYHAHWREHDDPKAEDRLMNLAELLKVAAETGGAEELLQRVERAQKAERPDAPIRLMTGHASKGLEADVVFLPAWEEQIFPSRHAVTAEEAGKIKGMTEERNVAYVKITRARRELFVTWASEGSNSGEPSRFQDEMRGDDVEIRDIDIPTLPRTGQPSTPAQREFAARIAQRLRDVSMPAGDITGDRRRLSVWIDRHLPAYKESQGTGGAVDLDEVLPTDDGMDDDA